MTQQGYISRVTAAYVIGAVACLLLADSAITALAGPDLAQILTPFITALFILVSALFLHFALRRLAAWTSTAPPNRAFRGTAFALALAASTLAVMGALYYLAVDSLSNNQKVRLSNLVDLQTLNLSRLIHQQEAAAALVATSPSLRSAVERWRSTGSASDLDDIRNQLNLMAEGIQFTSIDLLDPDGRLITGTGNPRRGFGDADIASALAATVARGTTTILPLSRDSQGQEQYGFLAPMHALAEPEKSPIAVILTRTAADLFLYPSLAAAAQMSPGTEVFTMRQAPDGNWIITSPQGDGHSPPLSVKVEPHQYDFALKSNAAAAAPVGPDHGGTTVIAVADRIPGSPSVLVAKTALRKVLQEAQAFATIASALAGVGLLLAFSVAVAITQRNRALGAMREIKQAKALNAAETRFRATFEQAAVGIVHLALDETYLRVNETYCRLLGYDRQELLHKRAPLVRHPDDADDDAARRSGLLCGQLTDTQDERRYIRKDGTLIWLSRNTSLVHDETGKPDYFIIVLQDITERRATEQALRTSEERFDLAVRGADEGVWDWNFRTFELYLSPRAEALFCLPQATPAALRHLWTRRIHRDDRRAMWRARRNLMHAGHTHVECEFRLHMPGGDDRTFIARGLVAKDETGVSQRAVGMISDVTERKEAERHLRLAAAVFDGSQDGLVVTNLTGTISAVNPAFTRITGYTEGEVMGGNMRLLSSGRHSHAFYEQMWSTMVHSGRWKGEIWNRRKDGELYLQELSITTVYDTDGRPLNYVGASRDITQIKRSEFELDHMAHFDPLTDLPNRTLLASLLDHAVSRPGARCAVLCVDLDRFKTVNESFGHVAGDEVLQMAAQRMRAVLASDASLGRYGADEFVVILDNLSRPQEAGAAATAIIAELAAPFVLSGGREVYVGASVGISLFPDDADNAQHLVQHADSALFEAKANGRGTYSFYTQALTHAARARVEMEADLRRALARKEFELHFQPFVELESGRLRGVETLVRWRSPRLGLVMPDSFIPLAEETGLIIPLGEWILEQACRRMAEWIADGRDCAYIAVNLSARQFNREDLSTRIENILTLTGLPAHRLELEITESMLFEKKVAAEEKLQSLAELGVKIALDDFGTGYSSLAYLKRFPITKLKIDRSFIRDLPRSEPDAEITVAIIAVAKALGLEVVAEGIETAEQRDFLSDRGCGLGQGYLFSRPVPVEHLLRLPLMAKPPGGPPLH